MADVEDIYPLTLPQQGMLFHSVSATDPDVYCEQVVWQLTGEVEHSLLAEAWSQVVRDNPVLRTSFVWKESENPLQIVHPAVPVELPFHDWSALPEQDRRSRLAGLLAAATGFDLGEAPLVRLALIRVSPRRHWLAWSCHHAILDGWSVAELRRDLLTVHAALRAGRQGSPGSRPLFRDHISWLARRDPEPGRRYWASRMNGFSTPLRLPDGFAPDPAGGHAAVESALSPAETGSLQERSRAHRLTISTMVQGAWALLLHRYTGAEDVVFGVTSSGRPVDLPGAEEMIGPFVTTTPLRTRLGAEPVATWLTALQREQSLALEHEHTPLPDIHAATEVPRGVPLFETVLAFENHLTDATASEKVDAVTVDPLTSRGVTNYPITVIVTGTRQLRFRLTYDRSRFDDEWMQRLATHLKSLLLDLAAYPGQLTTDVYMLTNSELEQLIKWNATDHPLGEHRLDDLFLRQVERSPHAVAVIDNQRTLTYRQLHQHSAALAARLLDHGATPDTLVAVIAERGWRQVLAVVAVLMSGAAYLPIDPRWPATRIRQLVEQGECDLALTDSVAPPDAGGAEVLIIPDEPEGEAEFERPAHVGASDLAYVIFTSGSTGVPKGVAIEHRAAANTILDINQRFGVGPHDRVLGLSALAFDLSVYDIFGTLAAGAALVLPEPSASHDPSRWAGWIAAQSVTIWNSVPAVFELLVDAVEPAPETIATLRVVLLSGDWIPVPLPDRFRALVPSAEVVSLGGATEASIWSIHYPIGAVDPAWDSIPYGSPLANQRFRVLDADLIPVPVGVAGQLFIAGRGLARGYWRDDERTAAAFVSHPATGERLYRTGDLGRYDRDGQIRFLGRRDAQVKINGFRVEPGEVEATLLSHPRVAAAAVTARGRTDKRLVAHVVAPDVPIAELRAHLSERLPRYLVPAVFVRHQTLPLTANGKIDRAALSASAEQAERANADVPPTGLEAELRVIWAAVLDVDSVGLDDNFFELGGDSLASMRLAAAIHRHGFDVPIAKIFDAPTIRELAAAISQRNAGDDLPPVRPARQDSPVSLTFAQEMVQILNAITPGNTQYVPRMSVEFLGALDIDALAKALHDLADRHPELRARFERTPSGQLVQRIAPRLELAPAHHDLTGLSAEEAQAEAGRILAEQVVATFDPVADHPLFRSALARLSEHHHILHVGLDHMVCDGWSMMLLHRDLLELYRARVTGSPADLPDLPVTYLDYAVWQREHLTGERLRATADFWRERMAGAPPMQLPSTRPPVPLDEMRGRVLPVRFEPELLAGIAALARREGTTIFAVLMAGVQAMVWSRVHEDVITISAPVGGRTRPELENVVGCFVHGMMLPTDLGGDPSFAELVQRVRDGMREAWPHQTLPLTEMAAISEFATVNNMGTQGIALEWVDDRVGEVELPGRTGVVRATPWWPRRSGDVDMPPADLFVYLHRNATDGALAGEFMYNAARFDVPEITAVFEDLRAVLELGTQAPGTPLSRLTGLE